MNRAPVALFVYNRPRHTQRVLDALKQNPEARDSDLFVFSDAPKEPTAADAVAEVRRLCCAADGFRSNTFVARQENLGISRSIITGVTELVRRFGTIIVLEDDLVPSLNFLRYMNAGLNRYRHADEVISVHAYSYPVKQHLPETFFLRVADCWGWGTWTRGWEMFEADGARLLSELRKRGLTHAFDLDGHYPYTRMIQRQVDGEIDSWAILWYAATFLTGKLSLYPGQSQIQNIGADGTGAHVGRTQVFWHTDWGGPVDVREIAIEESEYARRAFSRHLRRLKPSLRRRIAARLSRLIRRGRSR